MGGVPKSIKKIGKGDISGVADLGLQGVSMGQLNTSGFKDGELGKVSDILLGKKNKGVDSGYLPLDSTQVSALGKYNELLQTDTDKMAGAQVERNNQAIRTAGDDSARAAQDMVAQRGLGGSSVGLNAILSQKQGMAEKLGANTASLPQLQYDMKTNNLNTATNGIQNILGSRIYKNGQAGGQRSGGILPLVTAAAGGYLGGAQGASAGYGLGNALTNYG